MRLFKALLIFLVLFTALVATCFILVRPDAADFSRRAELMVVFKGAGTSTEVIFSMLGQGAAKRFAIPGTPRESIELYTRKYGLPPDVEFIPAGDWTVSTFDDALQAGRIIREGKYQDVLLVVAEYHVARSKLLLLAETMGCDCSIRVIGLQGEWTNRQKAANWYNEAIKFPGSALEYAYFHLTGSLLTDHPRVNSFLDMLKGLVLMET
ncbi:MAG: hypothetical protein SCH71_09280 [Desulfobulbaceae bacterium]|nr:hypothetical protein [Desulfobulbaceae bacterium]